jgi:poly(3-hydroxybutyrate) depolymerase
MLRPMSSRNLIRFAVYLALATSAGLGCSSGGGDKTGGAGSSGSGNAGTTGNTGSAGGSSPGTAGTGTTAGTSGSSGNAGSTGTAGASGATGTAGASGTTGTAGSAGGASGTTGTAGAGGTTGSAGAGGGSTGTGGIENIDLTATPSMGCGKMPPATDTGAPGGTPNVNGVSFAFTKQHTTFMGSDGMSHQAEYLLVLPANYNNMTPYKLAFGMGGYTRDALDCMYGDCWGLTAEGHTNNAIVAIMTQYNTGALHPPQTGDPNNAPVKTGWELSNELDNNIAFFKAAKTDILNNLCVDTKRVFVAGGSSGGDMAHILGCRMGDELRGIASVGGCMANTIAPAPGTSPMAAPARGQENYANICLKTVDFSSCRGNVAVIMVHGFEDPHIPWADARVTHDMGWARKNGCMATNTPNLDTIHTTITGGTVIVPPPGMWNTPKIPNKIMCGDADGCAKDYPVRWCEHSDPGYDNSTHGWPANNTYNPTGAGHYIWEFWKTL